MPEPDAGRGAAEPKGRDVHPQLWQACAGSMCAVPPVGADIYYFSQGHAEHAGATAVDLRIEGAWLPGCLQQQQRCCPG